MTDSGSPETGTEIGSQKPGITGGWSDDKVLEHLEKRMEAPAEPEADEKEEPAGSPEEEPQAQKPTKKGPEPEEKPETEAKEEAKETESEEEEPAEEGASQETEPEEAWTPESVDELAEALEMDPKQLLGMLKGQAVIDGQAETITLQEALEGYQRQADYSRKMQAYQDAQKKFETEQTEFATAQQQRAEELEAMTQALWSMVPQDSDADLINRFTDEDGEFDQRGFFLEKARIDETKSQLAAAWQYVQQAREQHEGQQKQALEDYRKEQQGLLVQRDVDFADTTKTQKFQADAGGLLKEVGYSQEEIDAFFGGAFDHRQILLLKKAMRMNALENGQKKMVKRHVAKPKVTKPGTARSDEKPDRVAEARKRLRKARSNKDRDAAAMDIIDTKLGF